jgi:hypothetical protein
MFNWNKKKKEKEAIDNLNLQIGKLDDRNYPAGETWVVQTAEFIREYFSEKSEQYKYIKSGFFLGVESPHYPPIQATAKRFINECIQTIQRKGLYEPPRENILKTVSDQAILGWLTAIVLTSIWIGNYTAFTSKEKLENKLIENQDSLAYYRKVVIELNDSLKTVIMRINDTTHH